MLAIAAVAAVDAPSAAAAPTVRNADSFEAGLALHVNAVRRARGVPPLRRARGLVVAATAKAREMGRLGYFAHTSPHGRTFFSGVLDHYETAGYAYWRVGENLAWGPRATHTPAIVVRRWLRSAKHRSLLLSPSFRELGIGAVFVANGTGFWAPRGDVVVVALEVGLRRR